MPQSNITHKTCLHLSPLNSAPDRAKPPPTRSRFVCVCVSRVPSVSCVSYIRVMCHVRHVCNASSHVKEGFLVQLELGLGVTDIERRLHTVLGGVYLVRQQTLRLQEEKKKRRKKRQRAPRRHRHEVRSRGWHIQKTCRRYVSGRDRGNTKCWCSWSPDPQRARNIVRGL